MLFHLLVVFLNVLKASAQAANITKLCQTAAELAESPTGNGFYFDNDPNYVYSAAHCNSTVQKIVGSDWYLRACEYAIAAACGTTSATATTPYPSTGHWTFGWHTDGKGSTCQAALYQPALPAGDTNPDHYLNPDCCRQNFGAAQKILASFQGILTVANRASINIAPGGFPYTEGFQSQGDQVDADGMQIDAGLPSYILQA